MRDFIQVLLDFLVAEGALVGTPYKNQIQDQPDRATVIYELQPLPTPAIARAQVRRFQLVSRGATYTVAELDAWNCHDKLDDPDGEGEVNISGTSYRIVINSTPFKFKTDKQNRTYFEFSFSMSVPK